MDIPKDNWNYPELCSDLATAQKRAVAERIFREEGSFCRNSLGRIISDCQGDMRLSSMLAYLVAADIFADPEAQAFDFRVFDLSLPPLMPVSYCGGNMCFGRVFAVNHLAFSSPDSIVGFRNAECSMPQEYFKISKGLRLVGTLRNWVLLKLDAATTDDHTGILYSPLEKNFTVEFAHFPHDAERRILFCWEDC